MGECHYHQAGLAANIASPNFGIERLVPDYDCIRRRNDFDHFVSFLSNCRYEPDCEA
jgi:hypothetical protein